MKKNLLFNLSNFRAVALCLAMVCSVLAGWANPAVGDIITYDGVEYELTQFSYKEKDGVIGISGAFAVHAQTFGGDIAIASQVPVTITTSSGYSFQEKINVTAFDLSKMTISDELTSLTVNNSSYSVAIPNGCFKDKSNLKTVSFSGNVSSIDANAFRNCRALTSVSFGSVTSIGNYAFAYCSVLTSVDWGNSTFTTIPMNAFTYCSKLPTITIPSSVTSIGTSAFNSCGKLSEITIPSSVTSIGDEAFAYCYSLKKMTMNNYIPPTLGEDAFYGVSNCALVVPSYLGGVNYISNSPWYDGDIFKLPIDTTGIEGVTADDNAVEVERYNVNGVKLSAPQKGINIIKMSDGSVKKVVVTE